MRSKQVRNLVVGFGLLFGAGCDPSTGPGHPLTELPRTLTAAEQEVIGSSNRFAFDLLRAVNPAQASENVFISPLSVSMALGMTLNGAAGTTFDEMRDVLGFAGMEQGAINGSYKSLTTLLLGLDRTVEIGIGNSVWYRRDFPVEQAFAEAVRASFDAQVEGLDFSSPTAPDRINSWVGSATHGRINKIVESISGDDVMFLINAIYFKGSWAKQFDTRRTHAAPFSALDGRSLPVQMMSTDGRFRHAQAPDLEAVDLPYGNGAFTMTILLPARGRDVNEVLASLTDERWREIAAALTEREMMVSLPRFKLEYKHSLNDPLKELGMASAFQAGRADFSRLSPVGPLFISSVLHKTFVEVNEKGTEAAAVTSVTVRVTSAPPSVVVDRPFLFVIRERFSGTILFMGKIVEPSAPQA